MPSGAEAAIWPVPFGFLNNDYHYSNYVPSSRALNNVTPVTCCFFSKCLVLASVLFLCMLPSSHGREGKVKEKNLVFGVEGEEIRNGP